jgi:hypothetical protein
MITIIFDHNEKSMKEQFSSSKGLLGYDKEDKTFACEASDLDCAGIKDLPYQFILKIVASGNSKVFTYASIKKDSENEIQHWMYKSNDGFKFMVFND